MKTLLLILLSFTHFFPSLSYGFSGKGLDSLSLLQREVVQLFRQDELEYPDIPDQEVTVGFMINARNEIIVLDIKGNSGQACEYVKQVLNYKKVKFNQSKQLTRYTIKLYLIKDFY